MPIGYARVSETDGSELLDLQRDALIDAGVAADQIYEDRVSSRKDHGLGLEACRGDRHDNAKRMAGVRDLRGAGGVRARVDR